MKDRLYFNCEFLPPEETYYSKRSGFERAHHNKSGITVRAG